MAPVLADQELFAITDFTIEFIEEWDGETFVPEERHAEKCTNQTSQDTYCVLLADRANHCAKANDAKWWDFTACMYAHNGYPDKDGLASDSEFEPTVQQCALMLDTYSFADLKTCYTGAEGDAMARASAARAAAAGIIHPQWMFVNGNMIGEIGKPDPTADRTSWANEVKAAICDAYTGTKPSSCSSLTVV